MYSKQNGLLKIYLASVNRLRSNEDIHSDIRKRKFNGHFERMEQRRRIVEFYENRSKAVNTETMKCFSAIKEGIELPIKHKKI